MKEKTFVPRLGQYFVLVSLSLIYGCFEWECTASDIQELNGLIGDQKVIAYVRDCGATSDYTVNVSFNHPEKEVAKEPGEIFHANHGREITISKVSSDTVKVIYFAPEILKQRSRMNGIVFIYEILDKNHPHNKQN